MCDPPRIPRYFDGGISQIGQFCGTQEYISEVIDIVSLPLGAILLPAYLLACRH